jgi:hypothetical protein
LNSNHTLPGHWRDSVAPTTVPCALMEGADDILTPEEGLNEETPPLTSRVSLQEVSSWCS